MTVYAGNIIYASDINDLITPGWTSYTPVLGNSGGSPAIGNGDISGRYRRVAGADTVICQGIVSGGTTTNWGTGFVTVTLPLTAFSTGSILQSGIAQIINGGDLRTPGMCFINAVTTISFIAVPFANTSTTINNRGGDVSNAAPFTFGNTDVLTWQIEYQPA